MKASRLLALGLTLGCCSTLACHLDDLLSGNEAACLVDSNCPGGLVCCHQTCREECPASGDPGGGDDVSGGDGVTSDDGDNTISSVRQVSTCVALSAIPSQWIGTVLLTQDVDCSGVAFTPIPNFAGTFDGQGHTISHLFVFADAGGGSQGGAAGLFDFVSGATIRNVGVIDAVVYARHSQFAGILLGSGNNVSIERTFTTGTVVGFDFSYDRVTLTGGLLGSIGGTSSVVDSFSQAIVHGGNDYTGGFAGVINAPSTNIVRRTYSASPEVTAGDGAQGHASGRKASLTTYTWSDLTDSFALAQAGVAFMMGAFGASTANNVSLTASTYNSAAPSAAAFMGTGIAAANPPFKDVWDFTDVWQETAGFPTLRAFTYPDNWNTAVALAPSYQHVVGNSAITDMVPIVMGTFDILGCTVVPDLPAGIALNATTCVISGTAPAAPTTTTHIVTVSTSIGAKKALVSFLEPPPTISYAGSPYTVSIGTPMAPITATLVGNVTACSSSPPIEALEPNVTLGSDCTISGTPTISRPGSVFTIYAQNPGSSKSTSVTINFQ